MQTPLHAAVACGHLDRVRIHCELHGADVNVVDSRGWSPLHMVYDTPTVDYLVARGANLEARDIRSGHTPLTSALICYNLEVFHQLLLKGADPNVGTYEYLHLILWAAHNGQSGVILALCSHGVNANCFDETAATPMHYVLQACMDGNLDVYSGMAAVLSLLHHGADSNPVNMSGRTPLGELELWGAQAALTDNNRVQKLKQLLKNRGAV